MEKESLNDEMAIGRQKKRMGGKWLMRMAYFEVGGVEEEGKSRMENRWAPEEGRKMKLGGKKALRRDGKAGKSDKCTKYMLQNGWEIEDMVLDGQKEKTRRRAFPTMTSREKYQARQSSKRAHFKKRPSSDGAHKSRLAIATDVSPTTTTSHLKTHFSVSGRVNGGHHVLHLSSFGDSSFPERSVGF